MNIMGMMGPATIRNQQLGIPRNRSIIVERSLVEEQARNRLVNDSPQLAVNGKKPKQLEPMTAAPGSTNTQNNLNTIPEIQH